MRNRVLRVCEESTTIFVLLFLIPGNALGKHTFPRSHPAIRQTVLLSCACLPACACLMCLRINHIMYLISRVIRLFCRGGFSAVIKGGEWEEQGRWIISWCHCVHIIICHPHTTWLLLDLNQSRCQSPRWTAWLPSARLKTNRKISRRRKSRLLINVHHVALWRYRIDGPCTPHAR